MVYDPTRPPLNPGLLQTMTGNSGASGIIPSARVPGQMPGLPSPPAPGALRSAVAQKVAQVAPAVRGAVRGAIASNPGLQQGIARARANLMTPQGQQRAQAFIAGLDPATQARAQEFLVRLGGQMVPPPIGAPIHSQPLPVPFVDLERIPAQYRPQVQAALQAALARRQGS